MSTHNNWEERFDKDYPACDCRNNLHPHFEDSKVNRAWIKSFIKDLLQQEGENMIKKIEEIGSLPDYLDAFGNLDGQDGYELAKKDIITLLNTK